MLSIPSLPDPDNSSRVSETVHIGLGGNIGDVEASMIGALKSLNCHPRIELIGKSALYKTPPWGDTDQDWFLNACATLRTDLSPSELLEAMKAVEGELKREKTRRWGPRTIDLDILLFGDLTLLTEGLEIPHPRMQERGFVLLPLRDIAPDVRVIDQPIAHWLDQLETGDIARIKEPEDW